MRKSSPSSAETASFVNDAEVACVESTRAETSSSTPGGMLVDAHGSLSEGESAIETNGEQVAYSVADASAGGKTDVAAGVVGRRASPPSSAETASSVNDAEMACA
jgi:hypothetical protein